VFTRDYASGTMLCLMARTYFVYILASETRELYVGVTNNLDRRLAEHRSEHNPGSYSARHGTTRLVIEQTNPDRRDLAGTDS
jgi:putative endonuclease